MVQMASAFGMSKVIAFDIETYGTERVEKEKIKEALLDVFPTGPKKIIDFLDLRKPIYKSTAIGLLLLVLGMAYAFGVL